MVSAIWTESRQYFGQAMRRFPLNSENWEAKFKLKATKEDKIECWVCLRGRVVKQTTQLLAESPKFRLVVE